jgi:hypothetical protein
VQIVAWAASNGDRRKTPTTFTANDGSARFVILHGQKLLTFRNELGIGQAMVKAQLDPDDIVLQKRARLVAAW